MPTYIALLRGINVGGHRKVEMQRLQALFAAQGHEQVRTYLNTGNVLFDSALSQEQLQDEIPTQLEAEFGFAIKTLVLAQVDARRIAESIPATRQNNAEEKTDVAYLFPEIDSADIIEQLPVKPQFLKLHYVPGALIWHVERENYNKSQLNKLVSSKFYTHMTVRNVNTARYLAG